MPKNVQMIKNGAVSPKLNFQDKCPKFLIYHRKQVPRDDFQNSNFKAHLLNLIEPV